MVVDDTAVTPQYLEGSAAARELPIIKKIAIGSLRNKLLFILPAARAAQSVPPWLLPVILIFGGDFLAYEGADKVWRRAVLRRHTTEADGGASRRRASFAPEHEKRDGRRCHPHRLHPLRRDHGDRAQGGGELLDPDASIWMRAIVLDRGRAV